MNIYRIFPSVFLSTPNIRFYHSPKTTNLLLKWLHQNSLVLISLHALLNHDRISGDNSLCLKRDKLAGYKTFSWKEQAAGCGKCKFFCRLKNCGQQNCQFSLVHHLNFYGVNINACRKPLNRGVSAFEII